MSTEIKNKLIFGNKLCSFFVYYINWILTKSTLKKSPKELNNRFRLWCFLCSLKYLGDLANESANLLLDVCQSSRSKSQTEK